MSYSQYHTVSTGNVDYGWGTWCRIPNWVQLGSTGQNLLPEAICCPPGSTSYSGDTCYKTELYIPPAPTVGLGYAKVMQEQSCSTNNSQIGDKCCPLGSLYLDRDNVCWK